MGRTTTIINSAFQVGVGVISIVALTIVALVGVTYGLGKGLKALGSCAIALMKGEQPGSCL